jgi:hypothetical protein
MQMAEDRAGRGSIPESGIKLHFGRTRVGQRGKYVRRPNGTMGCPSPRDPDEDEEDDDEEEEDRADEPPVVREPDED